MSDEVLIALISALTAILLTLLPVVIQYARGKGVQISTGQEDFIRAGAEEAARYVEEVARGRDMTSEAKITLGIQRLRDFLDSHRSVPTPDATELQKRLEAALVVAVPGHGGQPTAAVAQVPAPDPQTPTIPTAVPALRPTTVNADEEMVP